MNMLLYNSANTALEYHSVHLYIIPETTLGLLFFLTIMFIWLNTILNFFNLTEQVTRDVNCSCTCISNTFLLQNSYWKPRT